jgi:hypothetical protein
MSAPPLPLVVGTDGVGRLEDRRVYIDATVAPFGRWRSARSCRPTGCSTLRAGPDRDVDAALTQFDAVARTSGSQENRAAYTVS